MMRASPRAVCLVLLTQVLPSVSSVAWPATPVPDPATVHQAQDRFRRGVSLYEEGDAAGALAELERAYQLVPNFKVLYNLGQISYQTRNYAAALEYFRRYLADGGDEVVPARRREVESEIRFLRQRTGHIDVRVAEEGSEISIDDVLVGGNPRSASVLSNVGSHRVDVVSASGQRRSRQVTLAGEETAIVLFDSALPAPLPVPLVQTPPVLAPGRDMGESRRTPDPRRTTDQRTTDQRSSRRGRSSNWLPWTLTAALAAGAGVTGGLALQRSSEARAELDAFPASKGNLEQLRNEQHILAFASDGLLLGTLVMAGISLYLSLSDSSGGAEPSPRQSDLARLDR